MIVADSNTILYFLIPGQYTEQAKAVFKKDCQWVAPPLWRSEFCNVLALYLRQGLLTLEQAKQLIQKAIFLMQGAEHEVDLSEVLTLSSISGCSAYDCEFVALAKKLNVLMVTTDRKLLKAFPSETISMDKFIKEPNVDS
ncbi:MAG: VapC toxin family PIN domain ribonuclease [Candidatus Parabeggiatoa sp. nov. 3]|nr:MAG: VapC toxin family PIN domain ribonuclease [Gammaproteobacteria bacterium]